MSEVRGELRLRGEGSELRSQVLPGVDPRQLALLLESLKPRPQRTFIELAREWHARRSMTLVEPRNEGRHIGHLLALHGLTEAELLPSKVEEALGGLLRENGGELARSTVNKVRGTGLQVVAHAIANREWREANPFELAKRMRQPKPTTWNTLALDEARALLNSRALRRDQWREACFAIGLGPRPGEIKGLLKVDVDLPRRMVTIRRSNKRDVTKTYRNRVLPIPEWLVPIFEEAMRVSLTRWVFPKPDGGQQRFDAKKTKTLRGAMRRIGRPRPDIDFKGLRHTAATLHREAGCDPLVIKLALGHSVSNPTDDIYSHVSFNYQKEQLEKLVLLVDGAGGGAWGGDHSGKFVDGDSAAAQSSPQPHSKEGSPMSESFPSLGSWVQVPSAALSSQSSRFYTVTEFAAELKRLGLPLSTNTIREYIGRGIIRGVRLGGRGIFKIPSDELVRFLKESGVEVIADVSREVSP